MENISKVRQSLNRAQKKQADVMNRLLNSQSYIAAQVYERYKTCGNKNCKCKKGELHGPFLWIYQNKKNQKILSTTVDMNKEKQAKDLAKRYKQWLLNRQKLRELNRVIQDHLDEMGKFLEKDAREFATARKSGRPKKNE